MTPEQIDHLRRCASEHQHLEFKEAKVQFDTRRLSEYCVALANEGGGLLLLGIADKAPRSVVGTRAFLDIGSAAQRLHDLLGFRVDLEEVVHPDGRVLVVHVPPRPRGTAYHLDGKYLMRSGGALVPMTEDQLRRIFVDSEVDWLEETTCGALSSQQIIELLDTQTAFELLKLPYPTQREGVLERLVHERLIEAASGAWSIRRLGALLLARRLRDFPDVARKAPRVVVFAGGSKLEPRFDETMSRGCAVGFQELARLVMSQLQQVELIEDGLRQRATLVPEVVVRELVANAIIHQDFSVTGASVVIEIFANRIEISNPGEPLMPVERFIDGYQSRNERLADLMRRMGICEERSSGIDRVIEAAGRHQLPAPEFRAGLRRTTAVVHGPRPFNRMDGNDRVRACYQHCALNWVMAEYMTNQSLRERFHLPASKSVVASQIISATIDSGLIKADVSVAKSRRFARYLPFWA